MDVKKEFELDIKTKAWYRKASACDLVSHIDENYVKAKRNNKSRWDISWGKWSNTMNSITKDRPEEDVAIRVFEYWKIRSIMLDMHKRFVRPSSKIKQHNRRCKKIKKELSCA